VHTVVQCYKEAIQFVLDNKTHNGEWPGEDFDFGKFHTEFEARCDEWDERLARVFNRGFWDGYYQGQTLGEWNKRYGSLATEKKMYCAKGIKYFSKLGVAEFQIEACELSKGDKVLITGPTTGVMYLTADEIRYNLKPVETAKKGWRISLPVPEKVRPSDKLYVLKKVEEF